MASEIDALFGQLSRPQTPDVSDPQPIGWQLEGGMPFALIGPQTAAADGEFELQSGHCIMAPVRLPALLPLTTMTFMIRATGSITFTYELALARDIGAGSSPIVVAKTADSAGLGSGYYVINASPTPTNLPSGVYWWVLRSTYAGSVYLQVNNTCGDISPMGCRTRTIDPGTLPGVGSPIDLSAANWPGRQPWLPRVALIARPLGYGVDF